jgi:hypothetical protein
MMSFDVFLKIRGRRNRVARDAEHRATEGCIFPGKVELADGMGRVVLAAIFARER